MANISLFEVEKIANLAHIELTRDQLDQMTLQINSILEFVKTLQSIDTKNIQPTAQVTGLSDVWREDKVKKCQIPPEEILKNAPELHKNFVKVRKVL